MTALLRLACALEHPYSEFEKLTPRPGTHVHRQTRHCEHQQANCTTPGTREATGSEECFDFRRGEAARGTQQKYHHDAAEQAGRDEYDFQGRTGSADSGVLLIRLPELPRFTGFQNMKESKSRTEQFMYTASSAANQPPSSMCPFSLHSLNADSSASVLYRGTPDPMGDGSPIKAFDPKGKSRASQNNDVLALDLDAAEEGVGSSNGGAFMQMQLVEQQVR